MQGERMATPSDGLDAHQAWRALAADPHGEGAIPPLDGLVAHWTDNPDDLGRLAAHGVTLGAQAGRPSVVWLAPDAPPVQLVLRPGAVGGNVYVLGRGNLAIGEVADTHGDSVFVCGGGGGHPQALRLNMRGPGNAFLFGEGSTSYGARCSLEGPGRHILVGRGCMFSEGIVIASTDHHAIIDLGSGQLVNPPASVSIGPHVWLGQEVTVLAGRRIGAGAIVGARAVVTADVAALTLAAGIPARMLRQNVTWHRHDPSSFIGGLWQFDADWQVSRSDGPPTPNAVAAMLSWEAPRYSTAALVRGLYLGLLGRPADPGGFLAHCEWLGTEAADADQIARALRHFLGSPEFRERLAQEDGT